MLLWRTADNIPLSPLIKPEDVEKALKWNPRSVRKREVTSVKSN